MMLPVKSRSARLRFCGVSGTGLPLSCSVFGSPGSRLGREVVVAPAVEPLAVDLPDEQAAARLEHADVARGVRAAATSPMSGLCPNCAGAVHRQAVVGAGNVVRGLGRFTVVVVVEDQVAGRLVAPSRVAGDAAAVEDRLDVAVVLDVLDAVLEAQAGLVLRVPLLAATRPWPWSVRSGVLLGQVEDLVVGLGGGGVLERRSASGCGRGSRRSRCGPRRAGAGARSAPCSAPCRACRASGT